MKKPGLRSIHGGALSVPILGKKKPIAAITGVQLTWQIAQALPAYLEQAKPKNCNCPDDKLTVRLNVAPDNTLAVVLGHEKECPSMARPVKIVDNGDGTTTEEHIVPIESLEVGDAIAEANK